MAYFNPFHHNRGRDRDPESFWSFADTPVLLNHWGSRYRVDDDGLHILISGQGDNYLSQRRQTRDRWACIPWDDFNNPRTLATSLREVAGAIHDSL